MGSDNQPDYYPEPCPMSPEERTAALAKLKANFTAADLQRFTELEEGIPFEDIVKALEEIDRQTAQESK